MDQFLTIKDMAARRGTDTAVGLVEEVITFAPELEKIPGRAIKGTSYLARVRTAYPSKGAFRQINAGVPVSASSYTQKRFNCFPFDAQLQIDEATCKMAEQEEDSMAMLQADEVVGVLRNKAIDLGKQFYMGTLNDPLGFPGLADFLSSQSSVTDPLTGLAVNQTVNANGSSSSNTCYRAWAIWVHPQGVGFLWGGDTSIDVKPWFMQRVGDANGNHFNAWCTNCFGFIGSTMGHVRAVGCVKNLVPGVDGSGATGLTDKMTGQVEALFPVGIQPNMWLMTRATRASLQFNRTITIMADAGRMTSQNSGGAAYLAPLPTHTASGVPITVTDSIPGENTV